MRFLGTKIHGILDYLAGNWFISMPYVLGFNREGPEAWICVFIGVVIISYSLFTKYELGIIRKLPMKNHLILDAGMGGLLIGSPWFFSFADWVYVPHVVGGSGMILLSVITSLTAFRNRHPGDAGKYSQNIPKHESSRFP